MDWAQEMNEVRGLIEFCLEHNLTITNIVSTYNDHSRGNYNRAWKVESLKSNRLHPNKQI